jgi:hypothetical protein
VRLELVNKTRMNVSGNRQYSMAVKPFVIILAISIRSIGVAKLPNETADMAYLCAYTRTLPKVVGASLEHLREPLVGLILGSVILIVSTLLRSN